VSFSLSRLVTDSRAMDAIFLTLDDW